MPIVQQGSINTTALVVPDLYVQIVPPQNLVLNGVPTNVVGVVGTAPWGPVGQPVIVATMADYAQSFGPSWRANTTWARRSRQRCSRVPRTSAASASPTAPMQPRRLLIPDTTFAFTALYTGSLGNQDRADAGCGLAG